MDTYGLSIVHDTQDAQVDIVFVHGLRGEATKTWTKDTVVWPRDLVPKSIPNSRVFLYGYDSSIAHKNGASLANSGLRSDAEGLGAHLAAQRRETQTESRPIIFVAHSLGGLVVAQLFVLGEQEGDLSVAGSVVKNIRGMIFLGTPFRGSIIAGPAEAVRRILQLFGVPTQEQTLKTLGLDSERLKELTSSFANLLRKRRLQNSSRSRVDISFFYEELPTQIKGTSNGTMVVNQESAQIAGLGDSIPIRADHSRICKFSSEEDAGYVLIISAVAKILAPPAESEEKSDNNTWVYNFGKANNVANSITIGSQHVTL